MSAQAQASLLRPTKASGRVEFIAMMAMLSAMIAFSIDAMLPALPQIAESLTPAAPNRAQLIITSFVLGMGLATFFTGPLSDRFGRRPVIVGGVAVYMVGAVLAWAAPTLEVMLAARVLQGMGAAGPRVVTLAMVRDRYSGTEMARTMSFVMMFFTLAPALAPSIGVAIMGPFGWRAIFIAFLVFSAVATLWLMLRQPETLTPANRRALHFGKLTEAVRDMFSVPAARLSIGIQALVFGVLFAVLSSTQQIFDATYGYGASFPLWFGGIALLAATANLLNARLVGRVGMRGMLRGAFWAQIVISALMVVAVLLPLSQTLEFAAYLIWTVSAFFMLGLTIGNLNALAMEPLGHIAGAAASIMSSLSTVGAVIIAVPVGLAYNGTPLPLASATLVIAVLALWLTLKIRRPSDPA